MDDRRRSRQVISLVIGWGLSLIAVGFLAKWIISLKGEVWTTIAHLDFRLVALSALLFMPFFAWRASAWETISLAAGYQGSRWTNWRMWALSEIARYIPGNVWSFAVRYRGARQGGVERKRSIVSLIVEAAALTGGASLVATIMLPVGGWMVLTAVMALVTIMILYYGPALIRKFRPADPVTNLPPVGQLYGKYVLAWAFYGAATATLWLAFPNHDLMSWYVAFGANVAAWLAGYLSIVTPMGLGVREVAFVALVPAKLGASMASLLAIVTRLMMAITELIFVGFTIIISRRRP